MDLIAIENRKLPPLIDWTNGNGVFARDATAISGIASETLTCASWGTAITTDFDSDGIRDILMNG